MKPAELPPSHPTILEDGTIIVGRNALTNAKDLKRKYSYQAFSVVCGGAGPILPGADVTLIDNRENLRTPRDCYQEALELCNADICVIMHDDVTVYAADWADRVIDVFAKHDDCVAVGLGGATGLGTDDIYKKPYEINQLARQRYCSNQTDAETHGARFTGVKQVAIVEPFFMAIKTSWLRSRGGWKAAPITHHLADHFIACEAARSRKQLFMVGCDVWHAGGGSSTKDVYRSAEWLQGKSMEADHQIPHAWLANEYRDVLPIRVPEPVEPEPIFRGRS